MSRVPGTGQGQSPVEGEKANLEENRPLSDYEKSTIAPFAGIGIEEAAAPERMSMLEYRSTIRDALFKFFQSFFEVSKKDLLLAAALNNSLGFDKLPSEEELKAGYNKDIEPLKKGQDYIDAYNSFLRDLQKTSDKLIEDGDSFEDVAQHIVGASQQFEQFLAEYEALKAAGDEKGLEELLVSCEELYRELQTNDQTFLAKSEDYRRAVAEFGEALEGFSVGEEEWNQTKELIRQNGKGFTNLPDYPALKEENLYSVDAKDPLPPINWSIESFEQALQKALHGAQDLENAVASAMASNHLNSERIETLEEMKSLESLTIPSFESYEMTVLLGFFKEMGKEALIKLGLVAGLQEEAAEEVSNYFTEFKRSRLDLPFVSAWGEKVPETGKRLPRSEVEKSHLEAFFRELNEKIHGLVPLPHFVADYTMFIEGLSFLSLRDAARLAPSMTLKNAFAISVLKVMEGVDLEAKTEGNEAFKKAYEFLLDHLKTQLSNYLVEENDVTVLEKADKHLKAFHSVVKENLSAPVSDYHLDQLMKGLDLLELGVQVRSDELKTTSPMRGTAFSV